VRLVSLSKKFTAQIVFCWQAMPTCCCFTFNTCCHYLTAKIFNRPFSFLFVPTAACLDNLEDSYQTNN